MGGVGTACLVGLYFNHSEKTPLRMCFMTVVVDATDGCIRFNLTTSKWLARKRDDPKWGWCCFVCAAIAKSKLEMSNVDQCLEFYSSASIDKL